MVQQRDARSQSVARLYALALDRAVNAAGGARAFQIIGATFRIALVAQEILTILGLQDESVPDATVRALMDGLRDALRADEDRLIG
jgi:hypothetical protein